MPKATIIIRNEQGHHSSGTAQEAELVLQDRETGQDIHVVNYWPWSPRSETQAEEILYNVAKREGYEITEP